MNTAPYFAAGTMTFVGNDVSLFTIRQEPLCREKAVLLGVVISAYHVP